MSMSFSSCRSLAPAILLSVTSLGGITSCESKQQLTCKEGVIRIGEKEFTECGQCRTDCRISNASGTVKRIADLPLATGTVTIVCGKAELTVDQKVTGSVSLEAAVSGNLDSGSFQSHLECR
jgi:hypothetical protein